MGNPNWIKGGPSPNPTGKARPAEVRADGWTNALTGVGMVARDNTLSTTFSPDIVDPATARDLWRGDDMAAKIIESYPNEMLRQGFEIRIGAVQKAPLQKPPTGPSLATVEKTALAAANKPPLRTDAYDLEAGTDPDEDDVTEAGEGEDISADDAKELQEQIADKWEELGVEQALWDACCYERAYGGGAVLIGAKDGQPLDKPLDFEKITSLDYVTALEPLELSPLYYYDDPAAPKYGLVSHYQLNPQSPGAAQNPKPTVAAIVHESRLIVFGGIKVSRRIQRGSFDGWGDSIFTRVVRVLRDFNMTWAAAAVLMNSFSVAVMKVKNLAELVINDKKGGFKARMQAIQLCQSILGMTLVDADGEDFERKTTSIAGLAEVLDKFATRFAAAADMPLTIIMGTSPGGLNATGESDIRGYYDRAKSLQKRKIKPSLKTLAKCTFPALGVPVPKNWSVYFCPLWQPTEKEQAETRKIIADTDIAYIGAQVVTPEEVGMSRWGGDEYSAEMKVDFSAKAMEEREATRAAQEELDRQALMAAKPEPGGDAPPPKRVDAFDPDQERDETGKWTGGGGSAGTSDRRASLKEQHPERIERARKEYGEQARINATPRMVATSPDPDRPYLVKLEPHPDTPPEAELARVQREGEAQGERETLDRIEAEEDARAALARGDLRPVPDDKHQAYRAVATKAHRDLQSSLDRVDTSQRAALATSVEISRHVAELQALQDAVSEDDEDYDSDVFEMSADADAIGFDEETSHMYLTTANRLHDEVADLDASARGTAIDRYGRSDPGDRDREGYPNDEPAFESSLEGPVTAAQANARAAEIRSKVTALADQAQAAFEHTYTAQIETLALIKQHGKALDKARDASIDEVSADDLVAVEGADDDDYEGDAFTHAETLADMETSLRESSHAGDFYDTQSDLKEATRVTKENIKVLSAFTGRASHVLKAKKSK